MPFGHSPDPNCFKNGADEQCLRARTAERLMKHHMQQGPFVVRYLKALRNLPLRWPAVREFKAHMQRAGGTVEAAQQYVDDYHASKSYERFRLRRNPAHIGSY